jgi:hypothetical protein
MMDQHHNPAIVYSHFGSLPRYFRAALENTRCFNPGAQIFLITDRIRSDLSPLRIEVRLVDDLQSPALADFRRHYVHLSPFKAERMLRCFERWFYCEQLRRSERLRTVVCLDSDYMLFHDIAAIARYCPAGAEFAVNGAAFVFIRGTLEPFLQFINQTYLDQSFVEHWRRRYVAAAAMRKLDDITDMNFLAWALERQTANGRMADNFPSDLPIGHLDHCIFGSHSLQTRPVRRHPPRKRVFWFDEDGMIRPFFRAVADGRLVPALGIHFQNGAKRKMHRFNSLANLPRWERALRLRYYNFLMN